MAPATSAASNTACARNRPISASAVETWVPFSSARPSLAASVSGSLADAGSASAAGMTAPSSRTSPYADQRAGEMGERREIARGADRAFGRDHRQGVVREQRQQQLDGAPAHARMAEREARGL